MQRKRLITFFKCNLLYKNSVGFLRKTVPNFVSVSAESELTANMKLSYKFFSSPPRVFRLPVLSSLPTDGICVSLTDGCGWRV